MTVVFDAHTQGNVNGATSHTLFHTVGSGSNRVLYVVSVCTNSTNLLATGTCSYGGTSLGSPIGERLITGNQFMYVWRMLAPPSGTANVVVTPSASAFLHTRVFSFSSVDQTTPNGTIVSSGITSQTSPVSNTPTVLVGGMAFDMLSLKSLSRTMTPGASQTQAGTTLSAGVSTSAASYRTDAPSMSWTFDGGTQSAIHIVVPVNPSSGGGGGGSAVGAGLTASPLLSSRLRRGLVR